jgi:hypothetical protein
MDADFGSLRELFQRLGRGEGPFDLERLDFIRPFHVSVSARSTGPFFGERQGTPQGIRRNSESPGVAFEWQRTADGWQYLAALIEPIVVGFSPGHQYLTSYPREDVIVVVSKGEYGDDVLRPPCR